MMATNLCPAQQRAHEGLRHSLKQGNIVVLYGADGAGKTTVLREIHDDAGGRSSRSKSFWTPCAPAIPSPWRRRSAR